MDMMVSGTELAGGSLHHRWMTLCMLDPAGCGGGCTFAAHPRALRTSRSCRPSPHRRRNRYIPNPPPHRRRRLVRRPYRNRRRLAMPRTLRRHHRLVAAPRLLQTTLIRSCHPQRPMNRHSIRTAEKAIRHALSMDSYDAPTSPHERNWWPGRSRRPAASVICQQAHDKLAAVGDAGSSITLRGRPSTWEAAARPRRWIRVPEIVRDFSIPTAPTVLMRHNAPNVREVPGEVSLVIGSNAPTASGIVDD